MRNIFKRKQCKQCGWDLPLFSTHNFCSGNCVDTYVKDQKEAEAHKDRRNVVDEKA